MNYFKLLNDVQQGRDVLYKNFSYKLKKTKHSLQLIENFISNEIIIGRVFHWKAMLLLKINEWYQDKDERERGYRLFFAIKVLNSMSQSSSIHNFLRSMKEITLEEVIFWVWQYSIYGKKAIGAYNFIHMN